jgi:gag-polyprotein putative aspartyl protease
VRRISLFAITVLIISAHSHIAEADTVPFNAQYGTLVVVPAVINEAIELRFTIDSAASDVSISSDIFLTLIRAGTITDVDMIDTQSYRLADGSERSSQRFRIRSLRIGTVEIRNVLGSVNAGEGDLLLGQSFLSKLKSWSIDNERHMLLLNESPKYEVLVPAKSAACITASPTEEPVQARDNLFRNTLAYLLTGDDLGKIRVVDRAQCVVELRRRIWPDTPDLVSVIHMNKVDRTLSSIRAISDVPRNRVDITLRGESVVDYLARPAFKLGQREIPEAPAHSASEVTITLYTDEVARVQSAWDYLYSHWCRGSKGSF